MKIGGPVMRAGRRAAAADHYTSDCPMAGHQIEPGCRNGGEPTHPISCCAAPTGSLKLLRSAYGLMKESTRHGEITVPRATSDL